MSIEVKTMYLRIINNDLELDGVKVARVLDITGTVLGNFEEMIERANDYEKIAEQEYEKGYEKGREDAEV
jgi:hypothetical protein|tara:strand:+ start:119 stop:328 length:210 start_codon:yes stop_codon:yes gene_type:complete